ncbi:MAG: efflux RND transporter permease subunit [Bacteroidales bacterium]|jgi:CzcA family heavy metal efflux pump|nr:efflux RND transporter permease subunit [Bacteroidales bacterium]
MLNRIIDFSLRNRLTILTGTVLLFVSGLYVVSNMDIDVFPELTAPTVVIMTEAPGMAPQEVERLVTFPIETAVNGSTGIRRVRSSSSMGFSIVWVEFDWKTDIYHARQTVTERIIQVSEELPAAVNKPLLAPQSSLLGEMMILAIESDTVSDMDLRTFAEWNLRPRLLSVPGVAQVTIIGGDYKEYQVLADPYKMKFYDVGMNELEETCRNMNSNSTGGFINQFGNVYHVRGIARTTSLDDIGNTVVKLFEGLPVRIKDVAEVNTGPAPAIGAGSYKAKDAVLVNIVKQPGINTVRLTEQIRSTISEIEANTEREIKIHSDIYNQADFINTSVRNVLRALIEGGLFVIIILFIFLLNVRTTAISLLAIPLSLLVSILALRLMGYTINTMSLGGMAIAIGSLVDDAIIDVENVYKHLRRNAVRQDSEKEPFLKVIYNASTEIRPSIFNATIIIIITFVPLFFLEGMEGRMLKPLGISFIVALMASLLVALTITPVLCSYLLTNEKRLAAKAKGSWVERKLIAVYRKSLAVSLGRKKAVLIFTGSLLIAAIILTFNFGSTFLPPFNEGALSVNLTAKPGISLEESSKIAREAEKILLDMPEIKSLSRKTGRAEMAEHSFAENISELDVPFTLEERSRDEFLAVLRNELNSLPGVNVEVGQPITHRMDHMLSGTRANIAIKIFGSDLNQLYRLANDVKDAISDTEGIGDINVEQQIEAPQIHIKAKRDMLARYGIPVNNFTGFINMALGGVYVSDVFEEEKRFPLVLRYNDASRDNIEAIRNAMIDTRSGEKVPLSFVADIQSSSGPNAISRENVQRKIVISVNVAGRDVGSVVKDIESSVNDRISLPDNYRIEYGGQFESAERATRRLVLTSILALLAVFIVLYQEFRNGKLAAVVLLNLPLALIGGVFAIKLTSAVISIPTIIGFITLFGIATRNGLLLISRYEALKAGSMKLKDRIINGSADRLNPILMTALTAALALIPLAAGGDKPGNEIQSPMAIVILGGLLSSTLLNIYVIPSVYFLMNAKKNKDE